MSRKSKDSTAKSKELIFLLAIARCIDAQSRSLAVKLDKKRYVYHAYAILDSLSSSYSMLKWFLEVGQFKNDANAMHDLLTSPQGLAAISAETLFLVSFSLLASIYDNEEKNQLKKFIANAWPYVRDVLKGLKNAYKGWKSAVQVVGVLSGVDLKYMIVPVGLLLSIFAAVNRLWYRSMLESRKTKMNQNKELLIQLQQLKSLTFLDREHYRALIKQQGQDEKERIHGFLAVGAGGLLDGLYLYIGVASLAALAPPLLLAMSILSVVYTLSCVITRIYVEYDFQMRLVIAQTKCELALIANEMELSYTKLLALEAKKEKSAEEIEEIKRLKRDVCRLLNDFDALRQTLKEQSTHSYWTAGLLGMTDGLSAYGVLTSILFTVSAVFLVSAAAFPPALLAVFIVSGLALMAGFIAYTLSAHRQHLQTQQVPQTEEHPYQHLLNIKKELEVNGELAQLLAVDHFDAGLKDGFVVNASPQFFFQEWLEIFRSLVTGAAKGKSYSNYATTPLQEADADGHYHETGVTAFFAFANMVLFSIVLGLRALARGFGRPPLGQVNTSEVEKDKSVDPSLTDDAKTRLPRESEKPAKAKTSDSLLKKGPSLANLGFFSAKLKYSSSLDLPHFHSMTEPNTPAEVAATGYKVPGLD